MRWIFLGFIMITARTASAASCCGAGVVAPSLIIGGHDHQLSIVQQFRQSRYFIGPDGNWQPYSDLSIQTTSIHYAQAIASGKWQLGFSLPIQTLKISNEHITDWDRFSTVVGYEALEEDTFHPLKPKLLLFASAQTGLGTHGAHTDTAKLPNTPFSHNAIQLGFIARKSWPYSPWDLQVGGNWQWFAPHNFNDQGILFKTRQQYMGGALTAVGYSWNTWRLGVLVQHQYTPSWVLENTAVSTKTRVANSQVSQLQWILSWMSLTDLTLALTWGSETLIGEPINTIAHHNWGLIVQQRW